MAKKLALVGILLVIAAGVFFMMMRRSHMMGAESQRPAGGLTAVSANGAPLPAPASAEKLPENTAAQESGGRYVSLGMTPYPPSSGGDTNFVVTLKDASGQPVTDATISLDLTMPSMWMPPKQLTMYFVSAGKYHAAGQFTMRGGWRIELLITRGGETKSVFFDVGL